MSEKKYTPKPGEIVLVDEIPSCNFCQDGTPGPFDFATVLGSWANGCENCWRKYAAEPRLGVGLGQRWVTKDQVAS